MRSDSSPTACGTQGTSGLSRLRLPVSTRISLLSLPEVGRRHGRAAEGWR